MIRNERGSALFISIVILLSLTFLGIFASNTSIFETEISGNERSYKAALASADGGINYATQLGINGFPTVPVCPTWNIWAPPNTIANVIFSYCNRQITAPRIVLVQATGTAPGGGTAVVSAGIVGVAPGAYTGPETPLFGY